MTEKLIQAFLAAAAQQRRSTRAPVKNPSSERAGGDRTSSVEIHRELLTAKEVACLLKASERTVRRWIADGTLPVVRLGRMVRIRPEALEDLLNAK